MNKGKILVIPSWYPSKSFKNNGSFFKEQTEALKEAGADVSVLCIDIPYRRAKVDYKYFKKNTYEENGVTVNRFVFPVGILHRFPKGYYLFLKWIVSRIYNKYYRKEGVSCIHAHSFLIGGYCGVQLKKKYGCRCVITEHTSKISRNVLRPAEKKALDLCVEESDIFICVSEKLKNDVRALIRSKKEIRVYPNMVSSIFHIGDKPGDRFTFCSVGNLIPLKNMDLLINSFVSCFSREEKVCLLIVGDGQEREKLQRMVREAGREEQIILTGQAKREKVAEILAKCNAMALVSRSETFGVVYIEAMASGAVVIGAHNGGADDIIHEENGRIVSELSIESVAKTLREVYNSYANYDQESIRENCLKKYGKESFADFYIRCFADKEQ